MRRLSFGSWLASTAFLLLALAGWEPGAMLSISLAVGHAVLLGAVLGRRASVAIQLRLLFSLVVLVGAAVPFQLLWWLPITGATVRLAFDYCLGGRLLMLMPWNRSAPLSWAFLRGLFAPAKGWARLFDGLGPSGEPSPRSEPVPPVE
jgi:hypothetical protein